MLNQSSKLEQLRNHTQDNPTYRSRSSTQRVTTIRLACDYSIPKPQLIFKDKIDNSTSIWKPRITDKPNAIEPLDLKIVTVNHKQKYSHPYEPELKNFQVPDKQLKPVESPKLKSLDETKFMYIDNARDFNVMVKELRESDEIAIDLEHHSERSYQGFTCLMQLSIKKTDYVVDTIALRTEVTALNEIFTDPTKLKIFHGGFSDIMWLQKDFSLYVVNMFDTCIAANILNIKFPNLGNLKKFFCQVDSAKDLQLTDWRIRPISQELLNYAREDTHYLIYIKEELTNLLISESTEAENLLEKVYKESTEVCLKTYKKPAFKEDFYRNMVKNYNLRFNGQSLRALKELVIWRDHKARQLDENVGYILKTSKLIKIAKDLPKSREKIFNIQDDTLVKECVDEILDIINLAIKYPLFEKRDNQLRKSENSNLNDKINLQKENSIISNVSEIENENQKAPDVSSLEDKVEKKKKRKRFNRRKKNPNRVEVSNNP